MKKAITLILRSGVVALILACLVFWFPTTLISTGERQDNPNKWGYMVKKYRFHNGAWLRIWDSRGLDMNSYDPNVSVRYLKAEQWLPNNSGIYLDLELYVWEDNGTFGVPAKILYDRNGSKIYITSEMAVWREGDWDGVSRIKTSEDELKRILAGLNQ